jgi:hypothetical protein
MELGDRARVFTAGGTDGNEQLTAITGAILVVLLAAIGVTIVLIGQLISVHLFLGLLLIGPVALKMASTGYRFARYYTHDPAYREKGPPELLLRVIAPIVVLSTVVVFASGVVLLFVGRARRDMDQLLLIHKVSFIVWGYSLACTVWSTSAGWRGRCAWKRGAAASSQRLRGAADGRSLSPERSSAGSCWR